MSILILPEEPETIPENIIYDPISGLTRISGDYYKLIRNDIAPNFWSANGKKRPDNDPYPKGILNSKNDPILAEVGGLCCEAVYAAFYRLEPDFDFNNRGKVVDFVHPSGEKIDIKGRITPFSMCSELWITVNNGRGKEMPLSSDFYTSASFRDNKENGYCDVRLIGTIAKKEIENIEPEISPAKNAIHWIKRFPHINMHLYHTSKNHFDWIEENGF